MLHLLIAGRDHAVVASFLLRGTYIATGISCNHAVTRLVEAVSGQSYYSRLCNSGVNQSDCSREISAILVLTNQITVVSATLVLTNQITVVRMGS